MQDTRTMCPVRIRYCCNAGCTAELWQTHGEPVTDEFREQYSKWLRVTTEQLRPVLSDEGHIATHYSEPHTELFCSTNCLVAHYAKQ